MMFLFVSKALFLPTLGLNSTSDLHQLPSICFAKAQRPHFFLKTGSPAVSQFFYLLTSAPQYLINSSISSSIPTMKEDHLGLEGGRGGTEQVTP